MDYDPKMMLLLQQCEEKQKVMELQFEKYQEKLKEKAKLTEKLTSEYLATDTNFTKEHLVELEEKTKIMDIEHRTHLNELKFDLVMREKELISETKIKISEMEQKNQKEEETIRKETASKRRNIFLKGNTKKEMIENQADHLKKEVDRVCQEQLDLNAKDIKEMEEENDDRVKTLITDT